PSGGHSGFLVTYRRVKQLFAWKAMKSDIKAFVASCSTCQQAKPDRSKYPGLLQPLPAPSSAWQIISMDFIEGLPKSKGKNCILVVVDKFTKYSHFLAYHTISQLLILPKSSLITFTSCMASRTPFSPTATGSSQAR